MRDLVVVPIITTSYSGSTWISNLISAHPEALNIGPAHLTVEKEKSELRRACLWHREECPFWAKFADALDPDKNFFAQLAEFSGKRVLVVYSPHPRVISSQFDASKFRIQPLKIVRDGRALVVSLLKHVGEKFDNFYDGCLNHLRPSFRRIETFEIKDADPALLLRYEEFVTNGRRVLSRVGERLGLEYDERAFRYWEFDRHPTGGNNAAIQLMRALNEGNASQRYNSDYYSKAYSQLMRDPDQPIMDERWKSLMNEYDRFIYDYICGGFHERFGYRRDIFSQSDQDRLLDELGLPKAGIDPPRTLSVEAMRRISWSEVRRASIRMSD